MNTAAYSLLTLRPDPERVDVMCIGALVLDAPGQWHIVVPPGGEKVRAVGGAAAVQRLGRLLPGVRAMVAECTTLAEARLLLEQLRSTLGLHPFEGAFAYASPAEFERQVREIALESVLPPPDVSATPEPAARARPVRPLTRARLRSQFDRMGILGRVADDIADHKVVRNFPVSLEHGLTAEFAVRNGVMHITETVDFEVSDESVRGKTFEAQAKCLVLRESRRAFGDDTQCYIVVSGGAARHAARSVELLSTAGRLVAVESEEDMADYLHLIATAAGATGQIRSDAH